MVAKHGLLLFCVELRSSRCQSVVLCRALSALAVSLLFCVGLCQHSLSVCCSVSGFVSTRCQSVVLCRALSALAVSLLFCVGLCQHSLSVCCSVSGFVSCSCQSVVLCRALSAVAVCICVYTLNVEQIF